MNTSASRASLRWAPIVLGVLAVGSGCTENGSGDEADTATQDLISDVASKAVFLGRW